MKTKIILFNYLIARSIFGFGQNDNTPKFSNISIDKMGKIQYTVYYFPNGFDFVISVEQLKNDKWVTINGGMAGIITPTNSSELDTISFSSQVKFHKGINTYRLRMIYPNQITSEEFQLVSDVSNDDGSLWIMDNVIYLDDIERYEILDTVGRVALKGESKTINISALPQGSYYFYTKKATILFTK